MSKRSKANNIAIGLDSVEIDISTEYELIDNNYEFVSPRSGEVMGTLKHKQGKQHGYRLNLCLPKFMRKDNVRPLSVLEVVHLYEIVDYVSKQMEELFGEDYPELIVSTAEVNTTAILENKENINPMMNMLYHMMLQKDSNLCVWVHGKDSGTRHKVEGNIYSDDFQVESIRTPRLSNKRMALKVYNKSLEENIQNDGIIRFEIVYSKQGLQHAKCGRTLQEFLTVESMKKLLHQYCADYKTYLINDFWYKGGLLFPQYCVNKVYEHLVQFEKPLQVAIMDRRLIEYDYEIFRRACAKYYDNDDSKRKAIYRVKRSNEVEIHEHVIDDFVRISRSIVNWNI